MTSSVTKLYDSIIISSCLLGSVYIFSNSLMLTNKFFLQNKKLPFALNVLNSMIVLISGSIFTYSSIIAIKLLSRH
jgi:uncharacterized membrane protein